MSMATDEFQHESLQDLKSIGEYLRAIVQGLENGHIELSDDKSALPSGFASSLAAFAAAMLHVA